MILLVKRSAPLGLLGKDDNNAVNIDEHYCFGGAKCRDVCPWGIPQRQAGVGIYLKIAPKLAGGGAMFKCDMCADLLAQGKKPACESEKYLPEQRLAYFFIGLVLLLLIITGLVKTAKNLAGWNISDSLYLWSAQLHNLGMFLIILGIIGHLMAFVFKANRPLLRAMFSGKVDSAYIVERHSLWQEGVKMARDKVAENNLDSISCHTKPLGEVSKDLESTRDISPFS